MRKWLFLFLGLMGIVFFVLQVFVLEYLDGFIGYLVCTFSVFLTIISFIKLFQISKLFRKFLTEFLDLLWFWG